ncbi:MAG: hypothetical protein Q9195_004585 [Heterodermia aff. obscurata]
MEPPTRMPFFLSPLDNIVPTTYAPLLLFFPLPYSETERAITCLLRGLRALFDGMPLLGGSVKALPDGSPQIGTLAVTGPWRTVDAIFRVTDSRPARKYRYNSLRAQGFPPSSLPMWDFVNMGHYFESDPPVMHVQITLIDGGFVLAPCMHHCVADGTGAATILRYWAAVCRGESLEEKMMTKLWQRPELAKLPGDIALGEFPQYAYSEKTDILKTRSQITLPKEKRWFMKIAWVQALSSKIGAFCKPIAIRLAIQAIFTTQSLTHSSRLLYFPYSELAKLKADATNTFPDSDSKPWISTLDVLSALIFCCTTQARLRSKRNQSRWGLLSILPSPRSAPPPPASARLMTATNTRAHHQPPLSPSYIGNMFLLSSTDTTAHSLLPPSTHTVAAQALKLRQSIQKTTTAAYLARTLSALRFSVPDISKVNYCGGADEDLCLVLSSWREQDMCVLDWGAEVRVRCERVRMYDFYVDGLGFVFPEYKGAREEGGGLEVELLLKKGAMRELEGDEFFGRFARWRDGGDDEWRGVVVLWGALPVIGLGLVWWGFWARGGALDG